MHKAEYQMTPEEEMEIMDGMNEVYKAEEDRLNKIAPRCHFRPMILMDYNDGDNWDSWWECSVCGHTKDLSRINARE